jgi:hypothetical protein
VETGLLTFSEQCTTSTSPNGQEDELLRPTLKKKMSRQKRRVCATLWWERQTVETGLLTFSEQCTTSTSPNGQEDELLRPTLKKKMSRQKRRVWATLWWERQKAETGFLTFSAQRTTSTSPNGQEDELLRPALKKKMSPQKRRRVWALPCESCIILRLSGQCLADGQTLTQIRHVSIHNYRAQEA